MNAGASAEPLTARPPDPLDNVRREIAIMKQLTHPNVIKVRRMHRMQNDNAVTCDFTLMSLVACLHTGAAIVASTCEYACEQAAYCYAADRKDCRTQLM
jgi:hypothetical protein